MAGTREDQPAQVAPEGDVLLSILSRMTLPDIDGLHGDPHAQRDG
jgi:hypothetical protein